MSVPRSRRFVVRVLLAAAVAGAGYLGWVSSIGTPAALELLPAGADVVVELRGAEALARRLSGTRFSSAFAASETRAWLERTGPVAALDALRAEIARITGFLPGRGAAFDIAGSEAAAAWYPAPAGHPGPAPWVAAGRLSVRAWALTGALRVSRRIGLGATLVGSERSGVRTVYSIPGGDGQAVHVFFSGRVMLAGTDRALVLQAARAPDASASAGREPALRAVRDALPANGELFAWVRGPAAIRSLGPGVRSPATLGALVRAGRTVEIDVAGTPRKAPPEAGSPGSADGSLPGIALLERQPLLFVSSVDPPPPALLGLLRERQRAVASSRTGSAAGADDPNPGRGYAVAVTGIGAGSGLFPAPQGLVMLGMADAAAADEALRLAFPRDARTAVVGTARALATRESFPLAGTFEFWGAAAGPRLIFATDTALIAAVTTDANADARSVGGGAADPGWRVTALASVSMEKALPLLRRWSAPLSGLVGARWPRAPQIGADLDLLAAIRNVRLVAGSDGRFERAAITIDVVDLP